MRSAGILMPITSLPSPYGVGTLGQSARDFISFLADAGQTYWQVLPICPTGYGDSPYQSSSSYAGNPYMIDLDELANWGLLNKEDYENINWGDDPLRVDYGLLYEKRFAVLRKASDALNANPWPEYKDFLTKEAFWLDDYALFMAIKKSVGDVSLTDWPEDLRKRDEEALSKAASELSEEISFYKAIQFLFFHQWFKVREFAKSKNISIIGDIPIYVALDSADVWSHPEEFQLNEDLLPTEVAGCPPDGFSADGQLWGNPLFAWDKMKEDGFSWWARRISYQMSIYDVIRIDHFRGFDSYYAIPYGAENAKNGRWKEGPGIDFFNNLRERFGELPIIAEDLGFLTESVMKLLKNSGFPGMKVLEFAFDSRDTGSGYLPQYYDKNCIVYTGTHDNDTILGWADTAPADDVAYSKRYLHYDGVEGFNWCMMRAAFASVADTAILQMADLLDQASEGRINIPSTLGENWKWRCKTEDFSKELSEKLLSMTKLYGR